MAEIQTLMTAKVGIFRRGRVLDKRYTSCSSSYCAAAISACATGGRANPEMVTAYRVQKM